MRGKRFLNYGVSAGLCYQRLPCLRICNHFDSSQDIFPPADYGEKKKKGFAKQMKDVNEIKVRIFKLQKFSAFKHTQALRKLQRRDC